MQMPESRTLGKLVEEMAQRFPDHEAIVFKNHRITYQELLQKVQRLAKGLLALGVKPGEKVAALMPNCAEWIITEFAAVTIGCVFVGINTWSRPRELKYLLNHSDTSVLVMTESFSKNNYRDFLLEICPEISDPIQKDHLTCLEVPNLRAVITTAETSDWGAYTYGEVCQSGMSIDHLPELSQLVEPRQLANIIYTSGSTSFPKGVMLLHQDLIENGFNIGERQHITDQDRVWFANPLFFSYGCVNALLATFTHGATFVLQEVFEPTEALRLISKENCTIYYATPNITITLSNHPALSLYDVSKLRSGTTFGTPANVKLAMEFGPANICNIYGLTETYGNCAVTDAFDPIEARMNSQGRPLPGNEIRIVDVESEKVMGTGEIGEIRVKGYVTPGYYKNEEANLISFDQNGFFRTGDLGWLDEHGRIHWNGRIKEMIKTGGINVSPAEVEEVLTSHPGIKQAYVVGLPDSFRDEIVGAFIELNSDTYLTVEEIIEFCRKNLASYKLPRYVEFRHNHEFPLTATGKIRRAGLREEYVQSIS